MTTTACDGAVRAADKVRHPSRVHVSLTQSVSQSLTAVLNLIGTAQCSAPTFGFSRYRFMEQQKQALSSRDALVSPSPPPPPPLHDDDDVVLLLCSKLIFFFSLFLSV